MYTNSASIQAFQRYTLPQNGSAATATVKSAIPQTHRIQQYDTPGYAVSSADLSSGNFAPVNGASPHLVRQLTYANRSRQSSSPHHHARAAAAIARSIPAPVTVSLTDPDKDSSQPAAQSAVASTTATLGKSSSASHWSILDMGGMGLRHLSPVISTYSFITVLYLNHNNLTVLSPAISRLVNLAVLDVSANKLTSLPPELGQLVQLRELLLFDNNLGTLPTELGTLYQLETLGLEGNPMDPEIHQLLIEQGSAAVILSLRENAEVGMPPPQREWVVLQEVQEEDESDQFTVLCYNVLCQKYATTQTYGYTPSWALAWDYRKELLMTEIIYHNADIVCLQEVEMSQFEDLFRERFKEAGGYEGIFIPKTRAKTMSMEQRRSVDGCATFYKASRFSLVGHHVLEYNQNALQRADLKECEDTYNRVMTKDNVALFVMLEDKESGSRVLVANSHLHWDPSFADVKLVQVGMLMEEMDRFAAKHGAAGLHSTVICGDFNSTPDSGVYELLSKGSVKQDHNDFGHYVYGSYTEEGLKHKLTLKSAYGAIGELPFTNFTPGFKGVLDYIWYTTNTLEVVSLLGPIDRDYLDKVVGFPNPHFPSDHIALMVQLKFKSQKAPSQQEANFPIFSKEHHSHHFVHSHSSKYRHASKKD